jgi:predicted DsbA family dithiol-disulfide isomerase
VFVTPSCKYCPQIAELSLSLAMQFSTIKTEIIEIQEYPDLANNYGISSVPVTVINDKIQLDGQISSDTLVEAILKIDDEIRTS